MAITDEITKRVHDMYVRHPFPPPQRRHTYRKHAAFVRKFLEEHGVDPKGKLFGDIACGTGLMLLDYAQEFPETRFLGFDISETSVDRANKTLEEEGVTNARCEVKNILELDLIEEFDYIVSWGTIHHLSDPQKGVELLVRALKRGGVIRAGIYGYYGNWERRIQQEIVRLAGKGSSSQEELIEVVREWAKGDRNFKNYYTAPPVDINDDDWVVDEFLHVWEKHYTLKEVISWLESQNMKILMMTDYYDQPISLDIRDHSTSPEFIERVLKLPREDQYHIIDMIVRPYWISLFAQKQ